MYMGDTQGNLNNPALGDIETVVGSVLRQGHEAKSQKANTLNWTVHE